MDIILLERFKKVAESEHLTKAAKQLHMAQPALSRSIAKLEEELGVELFDRANRQMTLNQYGAIVLRHVNIILDEVDSMEKELKNQSGQESHSVKLSLYAASKVLPDLIKQFNHKYPSIGLKIKQEDIDASPRDADIIIDSSSTPNTIENGLTLLEEDILLALPSSHPQASKTKIKLWDVSHLDFICLPKGKGLQELTDQYCKLAGFTPHVVFECDSPEMTRELISVGLGAAFIPAVTWNDVASENVVLKKISDPKCKRYINLRYQKSSYISTASILFRDFTKSYFKDLSQKAKTNRS